MSVYKKENPKILFIGFAALLGLVLMFQATYEQIISTQNSLFMHIQLIIFSFSLPMISASIISDESVDFKYLIFIGVASIIISECIFLLNFLSGLSIFWLIVFVLGGILPYKNP